MTDDAHNTEQLLERGDGLADAGLRNTERSRATTSGRRPSPGRSIAGVAGGIISVGFVIWWLIGTSPAVQELDKRL